MKKAALLGLTLLFGSTASIAAPTSLSTTGTWQTATGDLAGLLGLPAPATWTYDTDLANAVTHYSNQPLPSGGTHSFYGFNAPTYSISGTYGGLFDGNSFEVVIEDNINPGIELIGTPNFYNAMTVNGLDTSSSATYDSLNFFTDITVNDVDYILDGVMLFNADFFNGPITTLPTGASLLDNHILLFAELILIDQTGMYGEATYSQLNKSVAPVPVPAAAFLFAPALLGFIGLRRKSKA